MNRKTIEKELENLDKVFEEYLKCENPVYRKSWEVLYKKNVKNYMTEEFKKRIALSKERFERAKDIWFLPSGEAKPKFESISEGFLISIKSLAFTISTCIPKKDEVE